MSSRFLVTAIREYRATALTPAFLFAVVLFPALLLGGITAISAAGLFKGEKSVLVGTIAVLDLTEGAVVRRAIENEVSPEQQAANLEARQAEVRDAMPSGLAGTPGAQVAMAMLAGRQIDIDVVAADPATPASVEKNMLRDGAESLLAIVIASEATLEPPSASSAPPAGASPGPSDDAPLRDHAASIRPGQYQMITGTALDADSRRGLEYAIGRAVVNERYRRAGYAADEVARLGVPPSPHAITVTAQGEAETADELQFMVPMVFMLLLWVSVFTGGQYLLMSTIEEKSSRVMEVLLSATSPTALLVGKIIGQGCVGLTVLLVYAGIGLAGVGRLNPDMFELLPLDSVPWLVLYFIMAYGLFASLMAAVGSAVNDIREAQSLMGPIMLLLMFPLMLWFMIIDNPNSTLAVVLSYVPFTTPFVMILRMSSTVDTVPAYQIITTTIVGFGGVVAVAWCAVKIFRIGVLMYGKPPSFVGLLKWVRYG